MNLSKETISILKSFVGVNTGIVVPAGNTLQVEAETKDIFVKAKVTETFPEEFSIYELPSFNNTLSMFDDPDLSFEQDHVNIKSGRNQCDFYYANKGLISHGHWLDIADEDYVLEFDLLQDDISNIQKASTTLTLDQLVFYNDKGDLVCDVQSKAGDTKNRYSIVVGTCEPNLDFEIIMRTNENFKFYDGDYKVRVAKRQNILVFCADNKNIDIHYQIATDRKSYFK